MLNPWEAIWLTLGYLVLLVLLVVAFMIVIIAVMVVVAFIQKARAARKGVVPASHKQDDYLAEATVIARSNYKGEVFSDELTAAFKAGARWGWGFFSRP